MRRPRWALVAAAVVVAVAAITSAVALSGGQTTPAEPAAPATTALVQRGTLATTISLAGILTYRARGDGSPYPVIDQARGTYTRLPVAGDPIRCGDVLYRVDERPVLLLCGEIPAYRSLQIGDVGGDVRQLNQGLHALGYDTGSAIDADADAFSDLTKQALTALQLDKGLVPTGSLGFGDAIFLPEPVRIASVTGQLGGPAQPGTVVAQATSDTPEVQLDLDPSQQGEVQLGQPVRIMLPGNQSTTGTVARLGAVAVMAAGQDNGDATIPAAVSLDDPAVTQGLDGASVQMEVTTGSVTGALSVPVVALVGKAGGGFAVEVVRDDGRHELVEVQLGLFDTGGGRVQVEGDVAAGDRVVVPTP